VLKRDAREKRFAVQPLLAREAAYITQETNQAYTGGHIAINLRSSELQRLGNSDESQWGDVLDHIIYHLTAPLCSLTTFSGEQAKERPARILVIGDSHTVTLYAGARGFPGKDGRASGDFENDGMNQFCGWSNYLVCQVPASSAYGLANNQSFTGAASTFIKCIQQAKDVDYIAIMIGEVDVRFLAFHRGNKRGVTILEQIEESRANLFRFIESSILSQGFRMEQILVLGAPLKCPQVEFEEWHKWRLNNDNSPAVLRYNSALKKTCKQLGCRFANPSDDLFDFGSGQIDKFFRSEPSDFHCSPIRAFFFWHRAIQQATELKWCGASLYE